MNTLHVRSVPEALYRRIQLLANQKNRSLSAQVITLLQQAIESEDRQSKHAEAMESIQRRRFKVPGNVPGSLVQINEDRNR